LTRFTHVATVDVVEGADPRALGAAITAALCGYWDHEPPCRWPHHTDVASVGSDLVVTTVFTVEPQEEADVRRMILEALRTGSLTDPDGRLNHWRVRQGTHL
jgi:hypothetical protein